MIEDIIKAIHSLRPGASFGIKEDGEIVEWNHDDPVPTEAEINDYIAGMNTTVPTLTRRQVVAALIIGAGITDPDGAIEAAISAIEDPVECALALNDWRNAQHYVRDHQLFNDPDLLAAMDMTPEQVDNLWALGETLPQ